MYTKMQKFLIAFLLIGIPIPVAAQTPSSAPTIVTGADLTKVLPTSYFFRGLSVTVQARNSSALKYSDGFLVLAGLVDTSGYSSDIRQKYVGFFITEKPLTLAAKTLPPGEYGMGFKADGKFHILDVAANELLTADATKDVKLAHPVPLKFVVENGETRLYLGRMYVTLAAQ